MNQILINSANLMIWDHMTTKPVEETGEGNDNEIGEEDEQNGGRDEET